MDHTEKVKQLEEVRRQARLGGIVIYPIANQQGYAMAPFEFAQAAGNDAAAKIQFEIQR